MEGNKHSSLYYNYWATLSSLHMRAFALSCYTLFIMFGYCLLETFSFLKGEWVLWEVDVAESWEEYTEGKLWLGCTVWEKNLFSEK